MVTVSRSGALAIKDASQSHRQVAEAVEIISNAPIFLRKTYMMIDSCDSSIAAWSENGQIIIIKDTDMFSNEVIPEFFKHNNFSSFVRQLNFYGFKKLKTDPLRLKDSSCVDSKHWKFYHEKFQRGRPDLLSQIRKSAHSETAEKQDVEGLRSEVKDLKARLADMSAEMEHLNSLVKGLMQSQQPFSLTPPKQRSNHVPLENHYPKKRKAVVEPLPVASKSSFGNDDKLDSLLFDTLGDFDAVFPETSTSTDFDDLMKMEDVAVCSLTALDAVDEVDLLTIELDPDCSISMEKATRDTKASSENELVCPTLEARIRTSLETLPSHMQEMFVERIVACIAEPEKMKLQVEAMTSLATAAAAEEAKRRLIQAGRSPEDPVSMTLASAVLGTYLTRYSASMVMSV